MAHCEPLLALFNTVFPLLLYYTDYSKILHLKILEFPKDTYYQINGDIIRVLILEPYIFLVWAYPLALMLAEYDALSICLAFSVSLLSPPCLSLYLSIFVNPSFMLKCILLCSALLTICQFLLTDFSF